MNSMIFDSSALISISQSCLIEMLERIANIHSIKFFIPKSVEKECVTNPIETKRFELNAMRIKKAINDGWIKVFPVNKETNQLKQKISFLSNNLFFINDNSLEIIQEGETEAVAVCLLEKAKGIIIDERTTRMLIENPHKLHSYLQLKHDAQIKIDKNNLSKLEEILKGTKAFRSTDLIAYAFEKKLFPPTLEQSIQGLEAALYALKYSGSSVSSKEIETYLGEFK